MADRDIGYRLREKALLGAAYGAKIVQYEAKVQAEAAKLVGNVRVPRFNTRSSEYVVNDFDADAWKAILGRPDPPAPKSKEVIATPREEPITIRIDFAAVIRQAINGFYLTHGRKPLFVLVPDIHEGPLHAWLGVPQHPDFVPIWNGVKILSSPDVADKVSAQDINTRWDISLSVEIVKCS